MTDGGLVLPSFGMDEAAIWSALKEIDPDLILVKPGAVFASRPGREQFGYRVYRKAGSDREPEFVCFWGDDYGNPYPDLSSGLIDRVKMLDKNTRGRQLDDLARDEIRRQQAAGRAQDAIEGAVDTWVPKHGRPILPRSQSLRRARDKRRAQGEKI